MRTLSPLLVLFMSFGAHAARDVQKAECLPAGVNWPVKAIYLHGWFKARGSDTNGFRQLEANNRAALEQIASMLQIRIAVPVSPNLNAQGFRNWPGRSLAQIEKAAQAVCGVAPAAGRALVGFSNGGYKVKEIASQPCSSVADYKRLIAIGAPGSTPAGCGKIDNVPRHEFPPRRAEYDLPTKLDLYLNR